MAWFYTARARCCILCLFFWLTTCFAFAAEIETPLGPQPAWDNQLDFRAIEERLKNERIVSVNDIKPFLKSSGKIVLGIHPVYIVELESGLKAVFKESFAYGEVAAYKAAKMIGLRLVPPTVLRNIKGRRGSLQFFVASPIDYASPEHWNCFENISHSDRCDMVVFYYVFRQWDSHRGNQIVVKTDENYYLALIDNGGILHMNPHRKKFPSQICASTFRALKKLNYEALKKIFSDLLDINPWEAHTVIKKILFRKDKVLTYFDKNPSLIVKD